MSSAAEAAGYNVTLVDSTEAAINSYADLQHELIIVDIRKFLWNSKNKQDSNNNNNNNKLSTNKLADAANPLPTRKIMKLSFPKKSSTQESKLSQTSSHSTSSTMNYDHSQPNKTNNCQYSYHFQHPFDLCKYDLVWTKFYLKYIFKIFFFYHNSRSIRNIKGSEYTTICALVERSLFDDDNLSIFNLGFNRVNS